MSTHPEIPGHLRPVSPAPSEADDVALVKSHCGELEDGRWALIDVFADGTVRYQEKAHLLDTWSPPVELPPVPIVELVQEPPC